jgi:cold shock CspA family protein
MVKRAVVTGRLIKWSPDRGFGFVRRDVVGDDIFISAKDARYSGLNEDDLKVGMRLSFVPWPDAKPGRAPRAVFIRVLSEAPA